jgi:hypothetical protein
MEFVFGSPIHASSGPQGGSTLTYFWKLVGHSFVGFEPRSRSLAAAASSGSGTS